MKKKSTILTFLDPVTRAYIETALMVSTSSNAKKDEEEKTLAEMGFTVESCTVKFLNEAIRDCRAFYASFEQAFSSSQYKLPEIGQDFFLARNRFGVGFISTEIPVEMAVAINKAAMSRTGIVFYTSNGKVQSKKDEKGQGWKNPSPAVQALARSHMSSLTEQNLLHQAEAVARGVRG